MALVTMTNSKRWARQFDDFIQNRLKTVKDVEALAEYLNKSRDAIYKRQEGHTAWKLNEALDALEFYGVDPAEVMR